MDISKQKILFLLCENWQALLRFEQCFENLSNEKPEILYLYCVQVSERLFIVHFRNETSRILPPVTDLLSIVEFRFTIHV